MTVTNPLATQSSSRASFRYLPGCLRFFFLFLLLSSNALSAAEVPEEGTRLHVVFDNVLKERQLRSAWGFAALVETPERSILFDTGSDGDILLFNMRQMKRSLDSIDAVFISHSHRDHTGGLQAVLKQRPDVTLYLPASRANSIARRSRPNTQPIPVSKPMQLAPGIHSTGEMGDGIREQSLVLNTRQGLVVITGCAHPGIADIAETAAGLLDREIYMLMGGFHLGQDSTNTIRGIIHRLKALGVEKVAPSHCTGQRARQLFRDAWGENFVESGAGAVIQLPAIADSGSEEKSIN